MHINGISESRLISRRWAVAAPVLAAVIATLLSGCMSAGGNGGSGNRRGFRGGGGRAEKSARPESLGAIAAIMDAQETAIAKAQGGGPDVVIPWSEPRSDIHGTIILDPTVSLTLSCRRYRQTIYLGGETLTGGLTACPQDSGSWKVSIGPL
jgi:surface antigen